METQTEVRSAVGALTASSNMFVNVSSKEMAREIETADMELKAVVEAGYDDGLSHVLDCHHNTLSYVVGKNGVGFGGYRYGLAYNPAEIARDEFVKASDDMADFADLDINNPDNDPKYYRLLAAIQYNAGKISKNLFQQLCHTNDNDLSLINNLCADLDEAQAAV